MADHAGRLQRLIGRHAVAQRLQSDIQLVYTGHRAELRHLRGHLRIVHRVQRILVLHLRDQQLEETILRSFAVEVFAAELELAFNEANSAAAEPASCVVVTMVISFHRF